MIYDNWGRQILNLRVSVTQKCNMHCPYCHREGENHPSFIMSSDEIERIVKIGVSLGISRVKITGGEPLLRKDILGIIEAIAKLRGLRDLSMTTNGALLEGLANKLRLAGLNRVNVSIPTLNPEIYLKLMGGNLKDCVRGIKAAVKAGLYPVKLNMLLLKNVNEREVDKMIQFSERTMTILQLIELEPVNLSDSYYRRYHLDLRGFEERLKAQSLWIKSRGEMQNRRVYFLPKAKVEVIHPLENTEFCAYCTRIRVTSDGKLKPCLMRTDNLVDILTPMRQGANDKRLTELFRKAIMKRKPYYSTRKPIEAQA